MQHPLTIPPLGFTDSPPTLNVLIAYEDFQSGTHAKKTYDFLVEHLGQDCRFTNQMWKFDVLGIPKLREIAISDAVVADIIIISCHGDELPEHVKRWIESWLMEPSEILALVALFDRPDEAVARTCATGAYLADIAQRAKIEFFAQPDDWPGRFHPEPPSSFRLSRDQDGKTLSTLAGVVRGDARIPHWDINE